MSNPDKIIKCMRCAGNIFTRKKDNMPEESPSTYTYRQMLPNEDIIVTDVDINTEVKALCTTCIMCDNNLRHLVYKYQNEKCMTLISSLCTALMAATSTVSYVYGDTSSTLIRGIAALLWGGNVYVAFRRSQNHLTVVKKTIQHK